LIPQLENLLRKIAEKSKIPIIRLTSDGLQDKILGDFLQDKDFQKIIGDDLNSYLFWFLADKAGLNLRNKVAHGFIKYNEIQYHLIVGIIEIIFILIKILKGL